MTAGLNRPRVAYIHAMGHSGSTILESLLGSHSACFNLGEIQYLHRFTDPEAHPAEEGDERLCTCGKAVADCAFWQNVDRELQSKNGITLSQIRLAPKTGGRMLDDDIALFEAVRIVSGSTLLIDSSKTYARLRSLQQSPDIDLTVLLLHANPAKVAHSQLRAAERKSRKRPSLAKIILQIDRYAATFLIAGLKAFLRRQKLVVVKYENLARDPAGALSALMPRLGGRFEERQLRWAELDRHGIGGNRTRYSKSSAITVDTAWQSELSVAQRIAIALGTLPYRAAVGLLGLLGGSV